MFVAPLVFAATSANALALPHHDSSTPTLMAVPEDQPTLMAMPSDDPSLMPIPAGAPSPSASADDMASDDGMAGMDSHSDASMPAVATPAAPQRHLVLAGFAAFNALVLGAAAYARRKGGQHRRSRSVSAARPSRNSSTGGAA